MRARMELLRHFGLSSIFQSASGPACQIFKAKNHLIRVRSRMFTGLIRILRASGMFQTIYNRRKVAIIQPAAGHAAEHTPTETTRRKSATQRQRQTRPETVETSAAATTTGTPATSPSRRTDRGPAADHQTTPTKSNEGTRAAKLPGTAAATTAATPTTYRV